MASDTPHKGIMLAERPPQPDFAHHKAFLPACAPEKLEPLGLTPAKKVHAGQVEGQPQSMSAYYRVLLRERQEQQQQQREAQQYSYEEEAKKKEAVTAFGEKLRSTILGGGKVSEFWKAADTDKNRTGARSKAESACGEGATTAAASESPHDGSNDSADQARLETSAPLPTSAAEGRSGQQPAAAEAAASTSASAAAAKGVRPGTGGSSSGKSKKAGSKPAWALSEEQAVAKQMDEEMELLDFAENLDFESFVQQLDDVELHDTFKALQEAEDSQADKGQGGDAAWRKSFVRALNHVAFKKIQDTGRGQDTDRMDTVSEAGRSEGAASRATHTSRARSDATAARLAALAGKQEGAEEGKWDSSSSRGGGDGARAAATKLAAAEEFLLENPELKGVHSNASVRAMLLKSEQQVLGPSPVATN